jgi:hypothetical protein
MSANTMNAELPLPIFKQGDDLADHLETEKDTKAGLLAYADRLKCAAEMIEELAQHGDRLTIQAGSHCIRVSGPTPLIGKLLDQGLLEPDPFTGEEEEESE